ncbi:transmembrane protein 53-like [Saccoglossus kowalevskii]|uniref:Uncharacterized protein LOC100368707 n=1 Tax=Saccoglossus kowalevskii TaxID=10224 RepID=A0ABM0LTY0_SACKO|nr:PREDICTED: uncharacterized protein LOC100368707 [Saccoglossus kowalevskii]
MINSTRLLINPLGTVGILKLATQPISLTWTLAISGAKRNVHMRLLTDIAQARNMSTHQISKYIELVRPPSSSESGIQDAEEKLKGPLVMMLPWLGSTPKSVRYYQDIYLKRNWEILMVHSQVGHFLWPPRATALTRQLLDYLKNEQSNRPIVIHAFSIGCYIYAMSLLHLAKSSKYDGVKSQIIGQIFDSMVIGGLHKMATGVAKTTHDNAFVQKLILKSSLAYFWLTKCVTVKNYDQSLDTIKHTPVIAPILCFYCMNDIMSDPECVEDLVRFWEEDLGIQMSTKWWPASVHAQHLRHHPRDYMSALDRFLSQLDFKFNDNVKARL